MAATTLNLNTAFQGNGTRFRVYPQSPALSTVVEPETIWVSPPSGSIGPGPADNQMYVLDALNKQEPYEAPVLPPFQGDVHAPARPDATGHFDHLPPGTRAFASAHMYAVIRRVLDVWELYFGRRIVWHFEDFYERLELIPQVDWNNAQSGFGFIESGYRDNTHGERQPLCLNFDVLAHEIGHSIIYSEVGVPDPDSQTPDYFGHHEAASDMIALLATLHFDSVVDRLLFATSGNLYALNELNRIAELSDVDQIRIASNDRRMSHYADGWLKEHHLSQPLMGAFFDTLMEMFHQNLIELRLIDEDLADAAYRSVMPDADLQNLQDRFDAVYHNRHAEFRSALLSARDYLGYSLAQVWSTLSPHHLTYVQVGHALLDIDQDWGGGQYQQAIFDCFRWREIGLIHPGPKLTGDAVDGTRSCR